MATAKTKSDALAYFLSDPAGLGGARSAVEFSGLDVVVGSPIPPLVVERVSPACGEGRALLVAAKGDQVYFQAPGDTAGTAVTVGANARVLLESGTPGKSCRVYRDANYSAADMEGVMTLDLVAGVNNAVGLSNITTAGATTYGCFWVYNQSDRAVFGVSLTPGSGYEVGVESPAGLVVQTIADDTTAPSAVSFGSSASIGQLDPGEGRAVWLKRTIGATSVDALALGRVTVAYQYDAVTYTDVLDGYYRIGDASLERYELHVGEDALPDFTSATQTSATLPFTQALTAETTSYYAVRKRNIYDLEGFNTLCVKTVVGVGGVDETETLTAPEVISAAAGPGGEVVLRLRYNGVADATEADTWRLYVTSDGSTPNPATDTPADTSMTVIGLARPEREAVLRLGPYTYGAVVKVIPRVYSSTLDDESSNSAVTSVTIDTQAPVGVHRFDAAMGAYRGIGPSVQEGVVYYDAPTNTVGIRTLTGEVVLFGSADAFRAENGAFSLFRTGLALRNVTHSTAGASAPVEAVSANEVYINVGGVRRCKIDFSNGWIEAARFVQGGAIALPVIGPVHATATATYIQVRNSVTGRWTPALMVESDGTVTITAPIYQEVA